MSGMGRPFHHRDTEVQEEGQKRFTTDVTESTEKGKREEKGGRSNRGVTGGKSQKIESQRAQRITEKGRGQVIADREIPIGKGKGPSISIDTPFFSIGISRSRKISSVGFPCVPLCPLW